MLRIQVGAGTFASWPKDTNELTVKEHKPAEITEVFAREVVTMGFSDTYTDADA
jgi:hypothetical protein